MCDDYKYKSDKHQFRAKSRTIDEMHNDYLDEFKILTENKPQILEKIRVIEQEINKLSHQKISNLDLQHSRQKNELKEQLEKLQQELSKIDTNKNIVDYFYKCGDIIYDYYDLTNGILYGQDTEENEKPNSHIEISKELMELTKINKTKKVKKEVRKRKKEDDNNDNQDNNNSIMSFFTNNDDINDSKKICKTSLQNEYLTIFDADYASKTNKVSLIKDCEKCNIKMILLYSDAKIVCPSCGLSEIIIIETDVPLHKETFNEKPKYPYKRIGHCVEKLNQLLCKKTISIPADVYTKIYQEIKKHSIEKETISEEFIHKVLKKNKWVMLYDDIRYIHSKITGSVPETITRDEYEEVLKRFNIADDMYEKKFKPKDRNNFLKYTYVLNKIFLSIDRPDIAKHFKLFKSAIRTKNHDKVWKYICDETGWKYFSS